MWTYHWTTCSEWSSILGCLWPLEVGVEPDSDSCRVRSLLPRSGTPRPAMAELDACFPSCSSSGFGVFVGVGSGVGV